MLYVNIHIQYNPFGKNFYSEHDGWFMLIVIPTGVHVQTCFDRVSPWLG